MSMQKTAVDQLDREFLEIRCRLLDVAAALDRMHRAKDASALANDKRLAQIQNAVGILRESADGRAERVQLVFSLPYRDNWRAHDTP